MIHLKALIGLLLITIALGTAAQSDSCDALFPEMPYSDTWCVDDVPLYINQAGYLHPENGCWICLDDARLFRFHYSTDQQVEMWLSSDLYTTHPSINNVQVVYWTVFDGCPYNGGRVISHPATSSNLNGPCWTFQDDIILDACFYNANGTPAYAQECYENPLVFGPRHINYVIFEFRAGVDYWMAIQPACSPSDPWSNYGCISVEFSGPNFLDLPDQQPSDPIGEQEKEPAIVWPRKIIHPRYGFLIVMPDGRAIDASFRQVQINQ